MQSLNSAGVRRCQNRSTGSSCHPGCHPVELIKLLKTQEMAACSFSRKRRSKGHEQELREELLQSQRIGIENYPSRKAFATHLSDSHSSTFPTQRMASLEIICFLMPVLRKIGRDKKNKKAAFTVARMKFLLNFQTQKTTQERIIVQSFLVSARLQVRQPSFLHDIVHAVTSVIHEKVYDKFQRQVSKKILNSLTRQV